MKPFVNDVTFALIQVNLSANLVIELEVQGIWDKVDEDSKV